MRWAQALRESLATRVGSWLDQEQYQIPGLSLDPQANGHPCLVSHYRKPQMSGGHDGYLSQMETFLNLLVERHCKNI